MPPTAPDRLNMRVMLMLAVLGVILAIVGWYRFFGF
jgi:hypothetical protein